MINAVALQTRLGVPADGIVGRGTYTALFKKFGANDERASELALAANVHFPAYGIAANPLRLAHFMAQVSHESGAFRYMEEIWGPTPAQKRYEGRQDLGNVQTGDGVRYKGRGPIQLTGRANYRVYGRKIGIDFERHPEIVACPSVGLWVACMFWTDKGLNALADEDKAEAITRRINGGTNGMADRLERLKMAKALLL